MDSTWRMKGRTRTDLKQDIKRSPLCQKRLDQCSGMIDKLELSRRVEVKGANVIEERKGTPSPEWRSPRDGCGGGSKPNKEIINLVSCTPLLAKAVGVTYSRAAIPTNHDMGYGAGRQSGGRKETCELFTIEPQSRLSPIIVYWHNKSIRHAPSQVLVLAPPKPRFTWQASGKTNVDVLGPKTITDNLEYSPEFGFSPDLQSIFTNPDVADTKCVNSSSHVLESLMIVQF
ncbi:hypothetical protein FHL15_002702 [Xylaria flabelliformis]|uniref:Uncharacterized protein n=1 Tax=Xylaria flabelliformis TaxID=2512241 RepID=A0A553I8A2_9PEZI|nr:hypothetical protein FHL15_002702 [Xylaria flabelliformis]